MGWCFGVLLYCVICCLIAKAAAPRLPDAWVWGILGPVGWIIAVMKQGQLPPPDPARQRRRAPRGRERQRLRPREDPTPGRPSSLVDLIDGAYDDEPPDEPERLSPAEERRRVSKSRTGRTARPAKRAGIKARRRRERSADSDAGEADG